MGELHCYKPLSGSSVGGVYDDAKQWGVPEVTTRSDPITGGHPPPPTEVPLLLLDKYAAATT